MNSLIIKKFLIPFLAPIMAVIFLVTLKPFLKVVALFIPAGIREFYLFQVNELSIKSDIGKSSLIALFLSIVIFTYLSMNIRDDSNIFATAISGVFFYFYFFIYFWILSILESKKDYEMNFKATVYEIWQQNNSPQWGYDNTLQVCIDVNNYFLEKHLNPAPKFRGRLERNDSAYQKQWILGCHFPWLNP